MNEVIEIIERDIAAQKAILTAREMALEYVTELLKNEPRGLSALFDKSDAELSALESLKIGALPAGKFTGEYVINPATVTHYRHVCKCGASPRVNRIKDAVCIACGKKMISTKVTPRGKKYRTKNNKK
jgi:hypothetical protein